MSQHGGATPLHGCVSDWWRGGTFTAPCALLSGVVRSERVGGTCFPTLIATRQRARRNETGGHRGSRSDPATDRLYHRLPANVLENAASSRATRASVTCCRIGQGRRHAFTDADGYVNSRRTQHAHRSREQEWKQAQVGRRGLAFPKRARPTRLPPSCLLEERRHRWRETLPPVVCSDVGRDAAVAAKAHGNVDGASVLRRLARRAWLRRPIREVRVSAIK